MASELLINTRENYADEFYYPIISFFNSAIKNYLVLKGFHYLNDNDFNDLYFGTNGALSLSLGEVKAMITNAPELDSEEYHYARKYLTPVPSIDIVGVIIERLSERIEESSPEEFKNFEAIIREYNDA